MNCIYHSYDRFTLLLFKHSKVIVKKGVFYCTLSLLEMEYSVCNKMKGNDRCWRTQVVYTDEDAMCLNGRKEQYIHCGMNMSSLCVRWRDWLGYLASISRTALGACCGGANDWASRAEPLLASAISEHACREKWVQGEVLYNMSVLLFNISCTDTLTHRKFIWS